MQRRLEERGAGMRQGAKLEMERKGRAGETHGGYAHRRTLAELVSMGDNCENIICPGNMLGDPASVATRKLAAAHKQAAS